MNKRRPRTHRRSRRSTTRALFDKLNAGLLAGASLPPAAPETTSPFGRPLHSIEELTKPFSAGSLSTLAVVPNSPRPIMPFEQSISETTYPISPHPDSFTDSSQTSRLEANDLSTQMLPAIAVDDREDITHVAESAVDAEHLVSADMLCPHCAISEDADEDADTTLSDETSFIDDSESSQIAENVAITEESEVIEPPSQSDFLARFSSRRIRRPNRHRAKTSERTQTAPPAVTIQVQSEGSYHPSDMGYTSWSFDPIAISGSQALQAETLYLAKLRLEQQCDVERVHYYLASFNSLGQYARLSCAIYDEQDLLIASGPEQLIVPTEYGQPQAALSLELEQPLSMKPGLYNIVLHCSNCEGHLALLCASSYRGAAYPRQGDSCRFAFGNFSSGFPQKLSWTVLQPGQAYWLAIS